MPLDPQCEAVLRGLESMGLPPIETMSIEQARETIETFRMMMGPPEDMSVVEERTIPGPGGDLRALIYTPEGDGPFPVLVYFHGGGFTAGSIDLVDPICRMLANRSGAIVVAASYRLGPEHPYPAAPDDAYAVVSWVTEHAAEFDGDPARLAVGGDSAGANLATVTCLRSKTEGGPAIVFQLLVYPSVDNTGDYPSFAENGEGYLLTTPLMEWFWANYMGGGTRGDEPYAAPMKAKDLTGLPPAFVITAEFDPLRDEGEAYAARLNEAGVPTDVRRYDGAIHAFFWLPAVVDQGRTAIDAAAAALRKALA